MSTSIPQHILVPHDFSETAEHALSYALDLAERLGARVTIVHAYDDPYAAAESLQFSAEMLRVIERAARTALDGVVTRARRSGIAIEGVLRQGTAWREIGTAAVSSKADLIVMGTHGRRGVSRALLGSVAEKVIRTAPCPVLTVHESDGARAKA
jgi:nucleotide-binding universal stress UspA family protein